MTHPMKMSPAEIGEAYSRDGFVIVPHLYRSDEAQALKAEIHRIVAELKSEAERAGEDAESWLSSGVYVGLAARSPVFREAVRDPRLLDVLEVVVGPNIEFISDKLVFKNAATDYASPWHQDWPYWGGCHKVSVWVALDDATPENGTLRVIPGTHRAALQHHDPGGGVAFSNRVGAAEIDESAAVTATLEAGGAVFFHDLAVHGSHASVTQQDRWVWIPTYRDAVEGRHDPDYEWAVAAAVLRGHAA